jgi:hypothetical protein
MRRFIVIQTAFKLIKILFTLRPGRLQLSTPIIENVILRFLWENQILNDLSMFNEVVWIEGILLLTLDYQFKFIQI